MRAGAFHEQLNQAGHGNSEALSNFRTTYVIDEYNTRRRVKDMTGADHHFVADNYAQQGRYSLMLSDFHRAVAKQVGGQRTEDVLTEDDYARLFNSLIGGSHDNAEE